MQPTLQLHRLCGFKKYIRVLLVASYSLLGSLLLVNHLIFIKGFKHVKNCLKVMHQGEPVAVFKNFST
jgi:hypothetical protein